MQIKTLDNIDLDNLTTVFNKAFENYFVPFKLTVDLLKQRIKGSGIDLSHSIGVFDDAVLIGFMLIAIDTWDDKTTAYNGGTGVIPQYRGQRLVKKMYEYAIPKFKESGVQQLILEVICENEKAIKAYQSVGMTIDRRLSCYSGEINPCSVNPAHVKIKISDEPNGSIYTSISDFAPAWDHSDNSILRCQDKYKHVELYKDNEPIGFAILNPDNGAIAQFGISKPYRRQGFGSILFNHLASIKSPLKLNNIDSSYEAANQFLSTLGFKNTIDQFEMIGLI